MLKKIYYCIIHFNYSNAFGHDIKSPNETIILIQMANLVKSSQKNALFNT